jgi:hypothetical protein
VTADKYTVRVAPNWRVCAKDGTGYRAYEDGELLELPLLQAAEWCGWGSCEPWWLRECDAPPPPNGKRRIRREEDD